MTMIKIQPVKPEHKGYDTGYFCICNGSIASYNASFGWMDRPEMTAERLERHVKQMTEDGFRVTIEEF